MKLPRLILPLALAVVIAAPAYAQSGGGPREACKADAQKFCKDIQPGGGRILDCLKDHYKEISDSCYQALQTMASRGPQHGGKPPQGNPPESAPPDGMQDEPPPPPEDDGGDQGSDSRE